MKPGSAMSSTTNLFGSDQHLIAALDLSGAEGFDPVGSIAAILTGLGSGLSILARKALISAR